MTEMLYLTDSYLREFEATVSQNHELGVVLDRMAFYPGGGGQPADLGALEDESGRTFAVMGCKRVDGLAVLRLEGPHRPSVGAKVFGRIDWTRRYQLMRTHTALHMLSGIVWRDYQAQVTGGNMEPLKGRLDFELPGMEKELVAEIEAKLQAEVTMARPIQVAVLPREEAFQIPDLIRTKINLLPEGIAEIRTVNIEGLDLQADGGTHVANTREVGELHIAKYQSKGKANKRLYLELAL